MTDLSLQLYSGRNYPLDSVIQTASRLGYMYVEGYGGTDTATGGLSGLYVNAPALRAKLDAAGLSMPTAHMGLDLVESPERALEVTRTLGINTVICPWLPPNLRPTDAAGWKALGERLGRAAVPFQRAGLTFGYHNHDFEFLPLPDGRFPMDVLIEAAPGISVEVDIAWVYRGNADPFPWLEKHGSRIVAIHVKDIAAKGENTAEDGWADVGHGTLPWRELMATVKSKTAAKYFVAEHDNPSDFARFAERTIASVKKFGA